MTARVDRSAGGGPDLRRLRAQWCRFSPSARSACARQQIDWPCTASHPEEHRAAMGRHWDADVGGRRRSAAAAVHRPAVQGGCAAADPFVACSGGWVGQRPGMRREPTTTAAELPPLQAATEPLRHREPPPPRAAATGASELRAAGAATASSAAAPHAVALCCVAAAAAAAAARGVYNPRVLRLDACEPVYVDCKSAVCS